MGAGLMTVFHRFRNLAWSARVRRVERRSSGLVVISAPDPLRTFGPGAGLSGVIRHRPQRSYANSPP